MSGERIAGYELVERIAVGGMAEIFRARKSGAAGFSKEFALKRVLPDLARNREYVQMFLDEARLAARLSSPGLVQVFDFGEAGGSYFLVMEYVDGLDLAALLSGVGPLSVPLALHLTDALSQALTDLHDARDEGGAPLSIVHRDVTPGNVLVSVEGHVKLADLGIAKAMAGVGRTEPGAIKGKLAYLSPEQARGGDLDARSDLYSLGLVLFEALTGQPYLTSPTDAGLIRAAESPVFRAPSSLREGVPRAVDELLRRALEPARELRFPSAAFLRRAIAELRLLPDPAEARRGLGELVRRVRKAPVPSSHEGPVSTALPAAPERSHAARPRTELVALEPEPGAKPRTVAIALGIGLVAALGIGGALRWGGPSPEPVFAPMLPQKTPSPTPQVEPAPPEPDPRVHAPPADPAPLKPTALRPLVHAPQPNPKQVEPARPDVAPIPEPAKPAAPDFSADRETLALVDRALSAKGVRRGDAADLWSRRDELAAALARGEPRSADLTNLAEAVEKLAVDRAFINSKIDRLSRKLAQLPAADQQRLKGESQEALSASVAGRYDEANRHLNAIAAIVEP